VPILIALLAISLLVLAYVVISPGPARLPWRRRRPGADPDPGPLARMASGLTAMVEAVLRRRGGVPGGRAVLEQAGVGMRLQEFSVLVIIATLTAGAAGLLLGGPLMALLLALLVPIAVKVWLAIRIGRRKRAFADQLEDSLQLLASSLRAGHSMLQALNAVAREAESPTSEEFTRIINETRVGREVTDALEETADRMGSDDFSWVTQAIAINREVGGNLAEVLDAVGETIRERGRIRRQVKSLSAEGKMSAYVLMALPIGITAFLSIINPSYMGQFTAGLLGYCLIGVSLILMIIGALWLRKVITIKF
jgi:tight adherence protein B